MDKKKLIIKNKSDLPILKVIKMVYELVENRGGITWGSGIDFRGAQLTSFYTSEYHVSCRETKHKCIIRFYKVDQLENRKD